MTKKPISEAWTAEQNQALEEGHQRDLDAVTSLLSRRGIDIEWVIEQASTLTIALPTWAFSQGGTRFGRFPVANEPTRLEDKLQDASVVHQLTGITPRVSLHIPWDRPDDPKAISQVAKRLELGFDAMNSNTFQDQPGQKHSYRFGSLAHTESAVRAKAIEHNIECIEIGKKVGSHALTVWLADGSQFPGQQHFRRALDRTIDSFENLYEALPRDWRLLIEHKPYEPAFYSTVVQDWGTALMIAQALGPHAFCLVDLGHHLPNCNIEQVVSRLISAKRLGGFHFNDSKYGDDDLTPGSIKPYQLFLIWLELVDAVRNGAFTTSGKAELPAYMIDLSATIKDPIEDLIMSACEIQRAYTKALLIDFDALTHYQKSNDPVMAERTLKAAYETDVSVVLAEIRRRRKAALDPIAAYRQSKYREQVRREGKRREQNH